MKKNSFLYVATALLFGSVESYAAKKITNMSTQALFDKSDRLFFEKNAENMSNTMSYKDFEVLKQEIEQDYNKKRKESPFLKYNFGNRQFEELPASADGSCLWDRLGIPPQKMFKEIIIPVVNEVSEKCTVEKKEDCAMKMMEIIDILDPFEKISNETEEIEARFQKNIQYGKKVEENWLKGVENNGGKELKYKSTHVSYRPPNGDDFFQQIAKKLNTNIIIFSLAEAKSEKELLNPSLKLSREFVTNPASSYLYLLDAAQLGLHYSPLIEVGENVPKVIIEEMKDYLKNTDPKKEELEKPDDHKRKMIEKNQRHKR